MTPALKAMVEAMAAEIARQIDQNEATEFFDEWSWQKTAQPIVEIDTVNLEKVARAGLQAIPFTDAMENAYLDECDGGGDLKGGPERIEKAFRIFVAAILQPESGTDSPKNLPKAPGDPAAEPAK